MQIMFSYGQSSTGVSGKVVDFKTQNPIQSVIVTIQNTNLMQLSDSNGKFLFEKVEIGNQLIRLKTNGYKDQLLQIEITEGKILDLGIVTLEEDITSEQQLSLVTITDNDLSDDNSGSESTAGLLQASKDVFLQAAAYNFGQARFSVRGIDNEYSNILINGVSMNRLSDGRPQYSNWGGLNDATRNQEFTNGSAPSDYTFGGIAGTQVISTRASIYRPGTRISFLGTNTNYSYRAMVTHASGMDKNGWAYVISGGRRWAQEGFFEGTDYAANSLFASIEKKINERHSINFTSIYAQNRRGKNSPNTQEVTDLKSFKYNSYWGDQEGEKRNSRVKDVEEPIFTLSHYWKMNTKTRLQTNLSYQFGQIGNSRIDFQKADNPDPNYYRKLPSYYTTLYSYDSNNVATYKPNNAAAEQARINFLAQPQIDWTAMYRTNNQNIANGSRYVLYEDRTDDKTLIANTILSSQLDDNIVMNAGGSFTKSNSVNFKNLLDLLGGTYYNDMNTFGVDLNQQQSDLNNPARTVVVGDKYGYNYTIDATRIDAFTQFKFTYDKIDFYLGQSFNRSSYQRDGLYKNGYYPDNSLGKSEKLNFDNFGFKGGMTYKLTGQHYFDFNGVYMTKAPNTKDAFPNARLSNATTKYLTNETIKSVDASYIIRMPNLKARFTAYFNETENTTDLSFYYADNIAGPAGNTTGEFVSEIVTGQNKRNKGIEAGIEYQITSTIKATAVAAYGDYTYTNNPNLVIHADGETADIFNGKANMEGYKQAGMPQQAYSAGIEYRDPKFWWISANVNYLSDNYLDVAPLLRTSQFISQSDQANFPYDAATAASFLAQEKFNSFTLVNLVGGKTWRIKDKTLGLFANVNNVFDIQYKTGGFEQARKASYSDLFKDHQGPNRSFGSKYFYGYGRTFMVNVYLNF